MTRAVRLALVVAAVAVAAAAVALAWWLRPFPPGEQALRLVSDGTPTVAITSDADALTLAPRTREPAAGLVFQPGARVDARAYVPLLAQIADQGYLVVIIKQPLGLAPLASRAPASVMAEHPQITHWVVGGHSLGGVVAAGFAREVPVAGLLLWAAYPADSMAHLAVPTVSLAGQNDLIALPADLRATEDRLPEGARVSFVPGAVHASFGDYGPQPGDGQVGADPAVIAAEIVAASVGLMRLAEH